MGRESGAPQEDERESSYSSIYLTAEDKQMMDELIEETGLGRSALVRLAVQKMYYADHRDRREQLLAIAEEIKRLA